MVCREIQKTRLVWAKRERPVGRGPILGSPGRALPLTSLLRPPSFGRFSDRNAIQFRLPGSPRSFVSCAPFVPEHATPNLLPYGVFRGIVSSDILGTDLDPPR